MTLSPEHVRVIRMENEATRNPIAYRLRIFILALLGYAFIFFVLLFTLAVVLLLIGLIVVVCVTAVRSPVLAFRAIQILVPAIIGVGIFALFLVRSLWVTVDAPPGVEIERAEAVPLFQEIDRLRNELKVPRFHRVLLTHDFNAAVVSRPRLGLFGWQEHFLLIGIPLMATIGPDHFRAVLAHEMGHISRAQNGFDNWVYRLWLTWIGLLRGILSSEHGSAPIFIWFFSWFAPLFDRHTFALRRLSEYESDRLAARAVGARTMADTLLTLEIIARSWALPKDAGPLDARTAQKWLNEAMEDPGDPEDTHPSLAARLRSLNQRADVPQPPREIALMRYLGHRAQSLAASVGITIVLA